MSYLIFARKFRPQTFEEVVGQGPVTLTLKNALQQGRIPQSFLFAGPRGVGKTSTARILAKVLNCAKPSGPEPCGTCLSCTEITQGNSLDVLEIDGASNRGIDEIRNLRETVKFKPVSGRYKIYIIDEVHMLTAEAFNALLKTLEEPPPHVKFVFATTEPHKVPLTILSRCQRFNFKRIPTAEIAEKLAGIAKSEKIQIEKNALFLIAKTSEGALRDAESLLDQLASFCEGKIKEEDVQRMLGLAPEEIYFRILSALKAGEAQKLFAVVAELYEGGRDLVHFSHGLFEMFRHLLLFQTAAGADEFVETSDEGKKNLKAMKDAFPRGELLLALSLIGNLQNQLRRNLAPPRLLVETALLKLLCLDGLRPVEDLGSRPLADEKGIPFKPGPRKEETPRRGADIPAALPSKTGGAPLPTDEEMEPVPSPPPSVQPTARAIEGVWPRVIEYVKSKRMSTGIFLSEATPVEVNESSVILALPSEFKFHKETLEKDGNKRLVEEAFKIAGGKNLHVKFVVAERAQEENKAPSADSKEELPEIIAQALEIFDGGRIIRKD